MDKYYYIEKFAATYGEGAYGSCSYSDLACQTSTGTSGAGTLTNTGVMVVGLATLACFIIFVAVLVHWWRRPRKDNLASEAIETTDNDDDNEPPASNVA